MQKFLFTICFILLILLLGYFIFYYFSMHNIKTPAYSVINKSGNIEMRQYQPMLIAEVSVTGEREPAIRQGFQILAGYIFGKNKAEQGSEKIAMTAPVMQQASEKIAMTAPVMQSQTSNNTWKVQFVMPAKYTLSNIPKPNDKRIRLIEVPGHKTIAIRFSGRMSPQNLEKHLKMLNEYVKQNQVQIDGAPQYAFYNPPWTLPFMRRNEIMYNLTPSN